MKLADTNSEFIRYSLLGVPTSFPRGDDDLDGDVDAADTTALGNFIAGGSYGWNLDFNGDGNTDTGDTDDHAAYVSGYAQGLGGRTVLSRSGVRNRAGYAGYEFEPALPNSAWHVRHRVLVSELGRWNRRDPLEYVDGTSMIEYAKSLPTLLLDGSGLQSSLACSRKTAFVCNVSPCTIRLSSLWPPSCLFSPPPPPATPAAVCGFLGTTCASITCPAGQTCRYYGRTSVFAPPPSSFTMTTTLGACTYKETCPINSIVCLMDIGTCVSQIPLPGAPTVPELP